MIIGESDFLSVGDKIQIRKKEEGINREYTCQILDKLDDVQYLISGPMYKNGLVPIDNGTKIEVRYYIQNKGRFYFNAIVKERILENIYKLHIERTSEVNRLQQRNYFRLPLNIKMLKKFTPLNDKIENDIEEHCITQDISGGGIRCLCNYKHEIGDIVTCDFLEELKASGVECEVIRIEPANNKEYKYSIGMRFTDISKNKRESIIKFIFEEQRKLRKKGLI
ncbi:flagellar brake protein [Caldisalinibacter kiritimatiensis]|uniref:Flagellar protein n=1 Tax=Caldisalinibacter kiritimatiensis TaxID=1304284 RepID=R1AST9_9FIRM|nr:flagellar brake protein [Caldisalinibacter kiritimatiensis]EOC99726.1 Flagellar protein [Caldisalinibacter kiritimatiensis]